MEDYLPMGRKWVSNFRSRNHRRDRFLGVFGATKLNSLFLLSLVLGMGMFFYFSREDLAYAKTGNFIAFNKDSSGKLDPKTIDPLSRVPRPVAEKAELPLLCTEDQQKNPDKSKEVKPVIKKDKSQKKLAVPAAKADPQIIDPLKRVVDNSKKQEEKKQEAKLCQDDIPVFPAREVKEETPVADPLVDANNEKYLSLVKGYPIEAMVPFITQQNQHTASFLVAIAKKESDWGRHTPKKNGKECYNYWGYKGGYNVTGGGYSCFDSPEQAVSVVGGRIADLVNKKIDTPERMLVWKCGSSCASHDPAGVRKWVADVSLYFYKLNS